ncbi:ice-binding family protein [Paraburkholderia sp. BCC1885]|uniref:ice-binding family protein n=1 Tax=Paraburkholderia sp. BCC1885 TaxID=2562669 RepID=UPI0011844747|nr:ice-binding family protein [Paraburkholderia sp. BCC1885]
MTQFNRYSRLMTWLLVSVFSILLAACGGGNGGQDQILGSGGVAPAAAPPTVTAVSPANNATGIAISLQQITAAFSEPMAPFGGAATFAVTCAAPCANPTGTVSLDASGRNATFSLAPGKLLAVSTLYTVTITGAKSQTGGVALASPFVWSFTTGATQDTTRPRVSLTSPATSIPGPTGGVPTNTGISAVFTKDIAPASINASSFTLTCAAPCTSPAGVVSYAVGPLTATFTPAAALAANTTYTATLTTAVTDTSGNALAGNQAALPAASNYIWTFTTGATAAPPGNISVLSVSPLTGAAGVCPDAAINATFGLPAGLRLDPTTVNASNFTVTGPGTTPVVAASITLDTATGQIASFTPLTPLVDGVTYTATIKGGATGVASLAVPANTLTGNFTWTFTAGPATGACLAPVSLGSAAPFGTYGGSAGMTNQGTLTVINGDIGTTAVSTAVTGFNDAGPGCIYTETPLNIGTVNGLIDTAAPPPTSACPSEGNAATSAIAAQASIDATAAYNALVALPGGPDPGAGNLANLVLAPGVYTAAGGSFGLTGGPLTLDAQGNANAVWVFQMATTLTVGGPGSPQSVILVNGAQAKNVFWQVGTAATLNAAGGGTVAGTIISRSGVVVSTAGNNSVVTVNGRLISLGASVTLVNTVINVPAQ